jgi:hypothetical protein
MGVAGDFTHLHSTLLNTHGVPLDRPKPHRLVVQNGNARTAQPSAPSSDDFLAFLGFWRGRADDAGRRRGR